MNKTCADCIHYAVCQYHITEETDMTVNECSHGFKDKSRFIELPCAVGDKVYVTCDTWNYDFLYFEHRFIYKEHFLIGEIVSIIKTKKQVLMKIRVSNSIHTRYRHKRYTVNAIGKTVFLTKEDAEKALKGGVQE